MWRSYPFDRLSAPPDIFIWYSEIEECSKAKERRNKRREKRRRVIHSVCEKTGLRTGSYQQSSSFPLVTAHTHTQTRTHTLTHSSCREDSGKGTQSLIRLGWLSHRQKVNILIACLAVSPPSNKHTHASSASSSSQYHPHAIHYILASGWSMMQWRRFQFLKNPPSKMLLKWASRFCSQVTIWTQQQSITFNTMTGL